ncbi:MAG: hypothetical protein IJ849_04795 [Selenomonadaceae bacterium]|nr:hypothetical protein [Selenomonadaceae bacterium]
MADKAEKDHWHPAFVAAMELDLREYRDVLSFDSGHELSKEPLKLDLLIIKKKPEAIIKHDIGAIFRGHNIVEYKSPDDGLTIDDYVKTVGYAFLYKGLGETVNAIPFEELTVTLVRDRLPLELFKKIKELGGKVEEKFPGVYYLTGLVNIPCQFVLTKALDEETHLWLKALTKQATEELLENTVISAENQTE